MTLALTHTHTDSVFHTGAYDPEGLLGTLNSIVLVYLGVACGRIAVTYKQPGARVRRWLLWSVSLILSALCLCGFGQYGGVVPINKNLWSTSYVLLLAGMAFFNLAVFYVLIDVKKWWSGLPLTPMGMNSIFVYVCSEVFQGYFPFSFDWNARTPSGELAGADHGAILLSNGVGVGCWLAIAFYMFKKKRFFNL